MIGFDWVKCHWPTSTAGNRTSSKLLLRNSKASPGIENFPFFSTVDLSSSLESERLGHLQASYPIPHK